VLILFYVGLGALVIQVIFFSALLVAFLKKRPEIPLDPGPISVIVCAHDEEKNLHELVPLLLAQDHPEFEVIIVEDRSNDDTYDYLLQATKENNKLKMVHVTQKPEKINGKKFALTLGIKAAKYDQVLLTDADCRPTNNQWVRNMSAHFQKDTQFVLGASPYEKGKGLLNSFIRFESLITSIQFIGFALLGKPYMGVGRNLAYKKEIFLHNKGFHPYLEVTGGDDDLFVNSYATKANTAISFGNESHTLSKPKTSWKDFYTQKLRHLSVGKYYKFSDKLILGLFSLSWMASFLIAIPATFIESIGLILIGVFLVRWILLMVLMNTVPRKLGGAFEPWKTPLLDFIYVFYYLGTGVKALASKKVKWKS
jgi:glycosyltransferase involved in cell wall biosynthesis